MRTSELGRYNIPEKIIGVWIREFGEELSPVQARAIKLYHVLEGKSLLISSPDTLGKTFLAEIAAVKFALEGKRIIYLVPLDSIVDEKRLDFEKKYDAYGIRILSSSRNIRKEDQRLVSGEFGIALIEYDKMGQLLACNPSLPRNLDLLIVEDLHNITEPDKGPGLEITLTTMAASACHPQLVGLLSVLNRVEKISDWLGADFICHDRRPVEVREDGSSKSAFQYKACYAMEKKTAVPFNLVSDESAEILISNVAHLVERGEQVIVFLARKRDTMAFARIIMDKVDLPGASGALQEVSRLEGTPLNKSLLYCLQKSISFHHSDLSREARNIIERYAQKGEIKVVFCTPSPPFGVRLPSATFLLHARSRRDDDRHHLIINSITWVEYENMCWAADKTECVREMAELYISAGNDKELAAMKESCCGLKAPVSRLSGSSLGGQLLKVIASGIATNHEELEEFLSKTLMGLTESRETVKNHLEGALQFLFENGMIEQNGRDGIQLTPLGSVVAVKGVSCQTAVELAGFVRRVSGMMPTESEILDAATSCTDGKKILADIIMNEYRRRRYNQFIGEIFGEELLETGREKADLLLDDYLPLCSRKPVKSRHILQLERWVRGLDTPPLERDFESYHGSIAAAAQGLSWVVDCASHLARSMGYTKALLGRLSILSERLLYGVEEKGLELARLRVRGLGRAGICKLVKEGFESRGAVRSAPVTTLAGILPEEIAISLRSAAESETEISSETETKIECVPSDNMSLCRDRIEITGKFIEKRNLVIINGSPAGITNRSLELLLHFAVALKRDGRGWVYREDLGSGLETTQLISRLRNELRSLTLTKDGKIIENDGSGNYRLSIPPQNVAVDTKGLFQHWSAVIRGLAGTV